MHRSVIILLSSLLFISVLMPIGTSDSTDAPWWNDNWSYRTKINIDIDSFDTHFHFQPIDMNIEFENPCWAKNEKTHSIRVIFQREEQCIELESQIYNLNYTNDNYINSCNLVFLIPEQADGEEEYYVYYDHEEKIDPGYEDHVEIKDSYYSYEPIPGLFFEAWYFGIKEEKSFVYTIAQKGTTPEGDVTQQVIKLKKNSQDVLPNSGEHTTCFAFTYWWYENNKWKYISTNEKLVSKKMSIDGNLMTKCVIVSESNDGLLRSTNVYKYYYSPKDDKKIYVNVKHEITDVNSLPQGSKIDIGFATMNCGGIRSSNIAELNFGDIPPYLRFFSEDERIVTYDVDTNPENMVWKQVIFKTDDCDLGSSAWISADYGETGNAQSLIFDDNQIIKEGDDEWDGIELQSYEKSSLQLPGLDGNFEYIYITRNSYEEGIGEDNVLPEEYIIEFNVEFFSSENGGYRAVEKEAHIFQTLIEYQSQDDNDIDNEQLEEDEYSISCNVIVPPSINGRILGSWMLLKSSYLSAEIHDEDGLKGKCNVGRVPITKNISIDWKNISFFRKANFHHLKPGKYIVKVFLENPLIGDVNRLIGYKIVEIKDDNLSANIFCKPEGKIKYSIINQTGIGIKEVRLDIISQDMLISSCKSDSNGEINVYVPTGSNYQYQVNLVYKGFLLEEKTVNMGILNRFIPKIEAISIDTYDFFIDFKDSKSETPDFPVEITLSSTEMYDPVDIEPDNISSGIHIFKNLYPSNYNLKIKYNQFEIDEQISISDSISKIINLYDLTAQILDNWNFTPDATIDVRLASNSFSKEILLNGEKNPDQTYSFTDLYPGLYSLKIGYQSYLIQKNTTIEDRNQNLTVKFPVLFNVTASVFDAHGNKLGNIKVKISRKDKETQATTNDQGQVAFKLPPGQYHTEVYNDKELIAQRNVEVISEKSYSVVTSKAPILPIIIITAIILVFIGICYYSYKKRNVLFFLKTLAILLVLASIITPWWNITSNSNNNSVSTSTDLYMVPSEMVTITSTDNIEAGELGELDEEFLTAMNVTILLIAIGVILLVAHLISKKYNKKVTSLTFFFSSLIFLFCSGLFFYAMSSYAHILVGGFAGNGKLDISIPGEGIYETVNCSWGPGFGFYSLILASIILVVILLFNIQKGFKKYRKNI